MQNKLVGIVLFLGVIAITGAGCSAINKQATDTNQSAEMMAAKEKSAMLEKEKMMAETKEKEAMMEKQKMEEKEKAAMMEKEKMAEK